MAERSPPDPKKLWQEFEDGSAGSLLMLFRHPGLLKRWTGYLSKLLSGSGRPREQCKLIIDEVLDGLHGRWLKKRPANVNSIERLMTSSMRNELFTLLDSPKYRNAPVEVESLPVTGPDPTMGPFGADHTGLKEVKLFVKQRVSGSQYRHFLLWCMKGKKVSHEDAARILGKTTGNVKEQWRRVKTVLIEYQRMKGLRPRKKK